MFTHEFAAPQESARTQHRPPGPKRLNQLQYGSAKFSTAIARAVPLVLSKLVHPATDCLRETRSGTAGVSCSSNSGVWLSLHVSLRLFSSENWPHDDFWCQLDTPSNAEFVHRLQGPTRLVEQHWPRCRRDSDELGIHVVFGSENPEQPARRIAHPAGGIEHGGRRSCP